MQFTLEEILDMAAEALGTCFFITFLWNFIAGASPYSLAAIVVKLMQPLLGG